MKRVSDKLHKINVKGTRTRDIWENGNSPEEGQGDGDKSGDDYKHQTQLEKSRNISTIKNPKSMS